MEDNIEYVSGLYQQVTEEPRTQELDQMDQMEEPYPSEKTRTNKKTRARTRAKKNGGKSKRKYKY